MAKTKRTPEQRDTAFWAKVNKSQDPDGCWVWTGCKNGPGYGKFWDGVRVEMAHRHSYRITCGVIPAGLFLCHKCDNPPCVRPDHLFPGTQQDNQRDAYKKGRLALNAINKRGIGKPRKLNSEDVAMIRLLRERGLSQQKIAERFGVNQTLISAVLRGKVWKHT